MEEIGKCHSCGVVMYCCINDWQCNECYEKEMAKLDWERQHKGIHKMEPFEGKEFWCQVCDQKAVKSDKPETGTFYTVAGTVLGGRSKGQYECIVWAVCSECDKA